VLFRSVQFACNVIAPDSALSCRDDLSLDDFSDLALAARGSNADIYSAKFKGKSEMVAIKLMREDMIRDPIVVQEFDDELAILSHLNHPNIIRVLGAGRHPRKFLVLEWLSGGSLEHVQSKREKLGHPVFKFNDVIRMSKEIASAMDYLHCHVDPSFKVIHRDLKPDNIGFAQDGTLKIFDFGLSTICVSSTPDQEYNMTGGTGSVRYMAPEVAKRLQYSEKVDVYSFGIIVWQMATGRIFKKNRNRMEILRDVVRDGHRPQINKSWSLQFINLLESSWSVDPRRRPSFGEIIVRLESLSVRPGNTGVSIVERCSSAILHLNKSLLKRFQQ